VPGSSPVAFPWSPQPRSGEPRYFGPRPLVEDGSARSPPYTTFDLQLGYRQPGRWQIVKVCDQNGCTE